EVFRRVVRIGLGTDAEQAVAQAAFERTQRLPFEAIDRIAGGMRLRDGDARELLAGIVVVADGAREIELTLPKLKEGRALLAERHQSRIVRRRDRLAVRLVGNVGRE